ncbi:MAG: hypothetical protein OEQ53_19125 [Saprospiraceae bacterium]|nr:hypothetical protein [Saprospiraceae bacterium]
MLPQNRILLITGMHRSGTSLCARWLHSMGLELGSNLMLKGDASNPEGYFEDYEFLHWHNMILSKNNTDYLANVESRLEINETDRDTARRMIESRNATHGQWAWKDPRACLFLPFWDNLIPALHKLILFRPPDQTVDSLLRREFHDTARWKLVPLIKWQFKPQVKERQKDYLKSWMKHYEAVLEHYNVHNNLLISTTDLLQNSREVARYLIEIFNFKLSYKSLTELLRKGRPLGITKYFCAGNDPILEEQAWAIYQRLMDQAMRNLND